MHIRRLRMDPEGSLQLQRSSFYRTSKRIWHDTIRSLMAVRIRDAAHRELKVLALRS